MDCEDEDLFFVSPLVGHCERKSWKSSKIETKVNGKWITFIDSETKEPLNSPEIPTESVRSPRLYKSQSYVPKSDSGNIFILEPPKDNYNALRPRRHMISMKKEIKASGSLDVGVSLPKIALTARGMRKASFVGSNPHKNPFRVSIALLNQMREKEKEKADMNQMKKKARESLVSH